MIYPGYRPFTENSMRTIFLIRNVCTLLSHLHYDIKMATKRNELEKKFSSKKRKARRIFLFLHFLVEHTVIFYPVKTSTPI